MKQLLAYQITGTTIISGETVYIIQTVGIDILTWNDTDLNGNEPFRIISSGQTIPSGYVDITTIENWATHSCGLVNDYLVCKNQVKELVLQKGWNNLTNTEKDIAIQYYAYPDATSAVIYLITVKGMSQQQAQGFILQQWHRHHGNVILSCRQRWYYAKFIVPQYLNFADAETLFNTIESLAFAYNDMGRLGIEYGDKTNGIMDYIESTNAYVGNGLRESGFTISGTWDNFIQAMKNVFVEGIYIKYDDIMIV